MAAVVWGAFASPRAPVPLPVPLGPILQALVFGSAVAGLVATGRRTLAIVFLVIAVINAILMYALEQ